MKKFFATTLACAMALSMAANPMAAINNISDDIHTTNDNGLVEKETLPSYAYGSTLLFPLVSETNSAIDSYDDVKGVSIKQNWDMNGSAVSKVDIVKKKAVDANYYYFLSVGTKESTSTKTTDVSGKVQLKRTGSNPVDAHIDMGFSLAFPTVENSGELTKKTQLFKFDGTEEETLSFGSGYFTVNTIGQSDILVNVNTDYNSEIASYNPQANLDFVNFNGATFNRIGELTLTAEEGSYIYTLNSDGTFGKVAANYDEYEEAFKIKTRTLGKYVISDVELKTSTGSSSGSSSSDSSNSSGSSTPTKPNPGTGAIA